MLIYIHVVLELLVKILLLRLLDFSEMCVWDGEIQKVKEVEEVYIYLCG